MKKNVLTVSQLTDAIKVSLEENFDTVSIQGELSNYKAHSSGHKYFTLKDKRAQISCVMWRSRPVSFDPADGMEVIANGRLTVYPPRGNYQIEVFSLAPLGQGGLYLAFEALKKKLGEAGFFEMERKRPLPALPMRIGLATSPTGAAVKDIFSTIERRFPALEIYFRPTLVQGEEAAADIVDAISELQQTPAQVMIVGRGGGSIEDLWAFNMENVAEAIFNSKIPVVSAVGHETDFTIADFTADLRAATPTAAAELVTPVTRIDLSANIENIKQELSRLLQDSIEDHKMILDSYSSEALARRLIDKIALYRQQTDDFEIRIRRNIKAAHKILLERTSALESHCSSLAPLAPLGRGFAIVRSNGQIIPKDRSVSEFKNLELEREFEKAEIKVKKILPKSLF